MKKTTNELNDQLATRFRALRLSKGMSVAAMAEALGTSTHRVTRIENRTSDLTAADLINAAKALGVVVSNITGELPLTTEGSDG